MHPLVSHYSPGGRVGAAASIPGMRTLNPGRFSNLPKNTQPAGPGRPGREALVKSQSKFQLGLIVCDRRFGADWG